MTYANKVLLLQRLAEADSQDASPAPVTLEPMNIEPVNIEPVKPKTKPKRPKKKVNK